jgi:hypothetical protein
MSRITTALLGVILGLAASLVLLSLEDQDSRPCPRCLVSQSSSKRTTLAGTVAPWATAVVRSAVESEECDSG